MKHDLTEEEAEQFFAEFYGGAHHIPGKIKACGMGWSVSDRNSLSTFDFNKLTQLVFLAHDRRIRVEVMSGAPGRLKIAIWARDKREGQLWERHPTIEQALKMWRESHPESEIIE